MNNVENLEKAILAVEVEQKQQLEQFVTKDFLSLIGSALVYLNDADRSDSLLKVFPEEMRTVVKEYIKNHKIADDEILDNVSLIFDYQKYTSEDVLSKLKPVMNSCNFKEIESVCQKKVEDNPLFAGVVRNNMFMFEDFLFLDDRNMQRVLRNIDLQMLAVALKDASEELKEKFFRNMSIRVSTLLKEDMEFMGPVAVEKILQVQDQIVDVVDELMAEGIIAIGDNIYGL